MKKYSLGNHIGYLLKGIWESNRGLMALLIVETVCSVITPYIAMYLPKIGVDLATNGASVRRAAALLLAITCVLVLSQGLGSMASRGKTRLLDRVRSFYRIRLFCKTRDCDYEHVESTEWQDKYEQAKEMSVDWGPWSATTLMSEGIVKLGSAVVSFFLYGSIIVSLSPWMLALILVLSAVNFLALRRAQKYEVSRIQERSGLQNRRGYMEQTASDMKYGKDIRLYELSGWIRQCFSHYNDAHFRLRQAVQNRFFHAAFVESLTLFVRDGIALPVVSVSGGLGGAFHRRFCACLQRGGILFHAGDADVHKRGPAHAGRAASGPDAFLPGGRGRAGARPRRRASPKGGAGWHPF